MQIKDIMKNLEQAREVSENWSAGAEIRTEDGELLIVVETHYERATAAIRSDAKRDHSEQNVVVVKSVLHEDGKFRLFQVEVRANGKEMTLVNEQIRATKSKKATFFEVFGRLYCQILPKKNRKGYSGKREMKIVAKMLHYSLLYIGAEYVIYNLKNS